MRGHRQVAGFSYHHGVFRTFADPSARMGTDPQCANDRSRVVGFYVGKDNVAGFKFTPGSTSAVREARARAGLGRIPASPRFGRF